jgi:hypothetical protein
MLAREGLKEIELFREVVKKSKRNRIIVGLLLVCSK